MQSGRGVGPLSEPADRQLWRESESFDRFLEVVAVARPTADHVLLVDLAHVPLTIACVSHEQQPGEVDDASRSQMFRSITNGGRVDPSSDTSNG